MPETAKDDVSILKRVYKVTFTIIAKSARNMHVRFYFINLSVIQLPALKRSHVFMKDPANVARMISKIRKDGADKLQVSFLNLVYVFFGYRGDFQVCVGNHRSIFNVTDCQRF